MGEIIEGKDQRSGKNVKITLIDSDRKKKMDEINALNKELYNKGMSLIGIASTRFNLEEGEQPWLPTYNEKTKEYKKLSVSAEQYDEFYFKTFGKLHG